MNLNRPPLTMIGPAVVVGVKSVMALVVEVAMLFLGGRKTGCFGMLFTNIKFL